VSAPEVHAPAQLADLRVCLADQWKPGRPFATTAAAMHSLRSITASNAEHYARHERTLLEHATLWWVAEDMVDLLLASAAHVPDDVHLADLPKMPGAGLVVFEKPWWGIDADQPDRQVQVDALLWGAAQLPAIPHRGRPEPTMALSTCTYRRMDFAMGLGAAELELALLTGGLGHAQQHRLPDAPTGPQTAVVHDADGRVVDVEVTDGGPPASAKGQVAYNLTGQTWLPLGRSDWPVADPIGSAPWTMPDEARASMVEDRKVLAALWTLLHQQGIASTEVRRPQRQAVRRTQRAGIKPELADVQVVTLRKLERTDSAPSDEHSAREWSHRWLVAGHWRWQPYGPGRSLRRLTYVRPHVKGPADKPFHTPTRVHAWVR
jgi:hypothetical protein